MKSLSKSVSLIKDVKFLLKDKMLWNLSVDGFRVFSQMFCSE